MAIILEQSQNFDVVPHWKDLSEEVQCKIMNSYTYIWGKAVLDVLEKDKGEAAIKCQIKADTLSKLGRGYVSMSFLGDEVDDTKMAIAYGAVPIEVLDEPLLVDLGWRTTLVDAINSKGENDLVILTHHRGCRYEDGSIDFGENKDIDNCVTWVVYEIDSEGNEVMIKVRGCPLTGRVYHLKDVIVNVVNTENDKREREAKREKSKNKGKTPPKEQAREDELYDWLRFNGCDIQRQVKTSSNHIIDLWIPNQMMIELKRSSVTGNDICQCIEYASEYKLPIVLVGDKINTAASRGLSAFNKLCPSRKIIFVTWDSVKDFLRGKFRLL